MMTKTRGASIAQSPRLRPRRVALGVVMGFALLLAGCGGDGRRGASGTVSVDGQPLAEGSIRFVPEAGTGSPTAGANITAGQFDVASDRGLMPGTFRVEVTASRRTDRLVYDDMTGEMVPAIEQYIPPKYNERTELTATVTDDGPNEFAFDLQLGGAE